MFEHLQKSKQKECNVKHRKTCAHKFQDTPTQNCSQSVPSQ